MANIRIKDTSTPVVVINNKLGGLTIMRSLGQLGVELHGVDESPRAAGMLSRYCRHKHIQRFDEERPEEYLDFLLELGRSLDRKAILIPTSDITGVFVCRYAEQLKEYFLFPANDVDLMERIINKATMFDIALENDVPTAKTLFPRNRGEVEEYIKTGMFPIMLKAVYGHKLMQRTGKKMLIVHDADELLKWYDELEDPDDPNLMIQEFIPGGDDQVYIFNGYFDGNSDCLAAFTGHKIRQYPIHIGSASLGECRWHPDVAELTTRFMKDIGYKGILDIGYRLDPRDGKYKVLDINPRVGQAFRIFVAQNNMDVVRSLYLDLTGQEQFEVVPREGRRWMIENHDIIATYYYFKEGSLSFGEWLKSFRKLQEAAWFSWRDPWPFLVMSGRLIKRIIQFILRRPGRIEE